MPRTAQQLLQQQAAKPAYVYELLEDILADPDVPKEHNLYAIVTDCTMPRLTRNGAYSAVIKASRSSAHICSAVHEAIVCMRSQTGCRTCV